MRRFAYRLGLMVLSCLLASCGHEVTDVGLDEPASPPYITTSQDSYQAAPGHIQVAGETVRYLKLTIELTYTNRSDEPIYISSCNGPNPPYLERWADGRWETAYAPPYWLCDGAIQVEPDEVYAYTYEIKAYDPDGPVIPQWQSNGVAGTYRLHWRDGVRRTPESDPASTPVPLEQRVSNPFQISGTLPW